MLNLPDTRPTMQRWRSVGPALIGQAGKETPCTSVQILVIHSKILIHFWFVFMSFGTYIVDFRVG